MVPRVALARVGPRLGDDVNWVRNVRAAVGDVILRHGRREEVRPEEVPPDQRAPGARAHLPIDKDAPLEEFERVSPRFPVVRVVPKQAS